MKDIIKKYTNGEVTIVWQPSACIHSTICWKKATGLPGVFNPMVKPWIDMTGSDTEQIVEQVKKCPSGALSFYMNNQENNSEPEIKTEVIAEVTAKGPLLVYGNITVKEKNGTITEKHKVTAFCRCGASSNKPYCDGTHAKINFEG